MSVTVQPESDILPQLRRLRRNFMGRPNTELPVIPPHRHWDHKGKRVWPSMTKETDEYVLCHTALGRQNILVDPNTFKIVSILDWETAGFSSQEWELPLWTVNGPRTAGEMPDNRGSSSPENHLFRFPRHYHGRGTKSTLSDH
ncbi:hypothetical protein E4U46_004604 [Claviceps purpurea]|nr:hypothetical protein E4U46_004604 [Claviceps purpurea]